MTATWQPVGSIRGPEGPPGAGGVHLHVQAVPASTWTIPHGFDRIPHSVAIYVDGQLVLTDTTADETHVVLEFPSPTTGEAHIL